MLEARKGGRRRQGESPGQDSVANRTAENRILDLLPCGHSLCILRANLWSVTRRTFFFQPFIFF